MWCSYNEWTNCLCVYRRLLANCFHEKAAELCLANSWKNRVATTKYIKYINSIQSMCPQHALLFLSFGVGKVLLWRHNQPEAIYSLSTLDQHLL